MLGAEARAVIVFLMAFSFFRNNMAFIIMSLQGIHLDIIIYGAVAIGVGGGVLWWHRRS